MKRFNSTGLLFVFLLSGNIMTAQVTKTLNGTVTYQSGMSVTKFSTPDGDIVVNLPQEMSGKVMTGTVSIKPLGRNEKERKKHTENILKKSVNMDVQNILLAETPRTFEWLVQQDKPLRTVVELLDASGVKIAEVSLPPVLSQPAINPGNIPHLTASSHVLMKGDVLNVYTDQQFSPGEKFVLTDSKGQQFTLKPICLSSQQAVITIPGETVPGECTVSEEVWNQPLSKFNAGKARFMLADMSLSSPNTRLRPEQQSFVSVEVNTGTGKPGGAPVNYYVNTKENLYDSAEAMQIPIQVSIDLRNLNPNIVTMAGGNLQRVYVNQYIDTKVKNEPATGLFLIRRNITGNTVGSFSVSATLHQDYNTCTDPFRPQMNILQTAEDFNTWINALKKDLKEYATVQNNDAFLNDPLQKDIIQSVVKANTQRAIDHMPTCTNPDQLDECKAVAYSLLRPLYVPETAAAMWLCVYEAFKASVRDITATLSGNPQLIDWELINKGLDYVSRTGKRLMDYRLINGAAEAAKMIEQIKTQGETKGTLQTIDETIKGLNEQINKVQTEMPGSMKNLLPGGILFSTRFTPPGMTDLLVEITDIAWSKTPSDATKDAIKVEWHFTGDIKVKDLSARVNWVSKDGNQSGSADFKLPFKDGSDFHNCDTLPIMIDWPDGFKSSGIVKPLPKDELDAGKTKVIVFVNGKKVGEGKPED